MIKDTEMKKSLLVITTAFLLLFPVSSINAAEKDPQFISMNIPGAVISNALQQILPLTLEGTSSKLEGTITIVGISDLQLHDRRIFCRIDLRGDDLDLITTVADQDIRLRLGSADLDFDCEAELRYDATLQTLYVKPIARGVQTDQALQKGEIGNALLLFLNGREFPLALEDIQPVIAEAGNKIITIETRIADIKAVEGALQFSLHPIVTTAPANETIQQ